MSWCVAVLFIACVGVTGGLDCDSPRFTSYTVKSFRNDTGHWISQVLVGIESEKKDMELEVNQTASKCNGTKSILIAAILTASPVTHKEPVAATTPAAVSVSESVLIPAETTPEEPETTPAVPSYVFIEGFGLYKLHTTLKIWEEADEVCRNEEAHLLVLNSDAEAQACVALWEGIDRSVRYGYAGFKLLDDFFTVTGQTLAEAGYEEFGEGLPINGECGGVSRYGKLLLQTCDTPLMFICEKE